MELSCDKSLSDKSHFRYKSILTRNCYLNGIISITHCVVVTGQVPYFVAVDHSTSSVVVAIRGTLSFHDALTDLAAVTESIAVDGLPSDWTAHRGMLQAANYVLRQLTNTDVLAAAFAQYPDYHLVVTGMPSGHFL